MRESDAKKGLVLAWSWGGVEAIVVGSLGAGSDKGETELRLPLRLFFGFVKFCFCFLAGVVVVLLAGSLL